MAYVNKLSCKQPGQMRETAHFTVLPDQDPIECKVQTLSSAEALSWIVVISQLRLVHRNFSDIITKHTVFFHTVSPGNSIPGCYGCPPSP